MAFSKVSIALGVLLFVTFVSADDFKCYQCSPCKEVKDADSKVCADAEKDFKGCYIQKIDDGWKRGCAKDKTTACGDKKSEDCTFCDKAECNSAGSVAASVVLSAATLLLLKINY